MFALPSIHHTSHLHRKLCVILRQSMLVGGLQDKVTPVITHRPAWVIGRPDDSQADSAHLSMSALAAERYSGDQYQDGFDAMLSGQAGKVVPISACLGALHVNM